MLYYILKTKKYDIKNTFIWIITINYIFIY